MSAKDNLDAVGRGDLICMLREERANSEALIESARILALALAVRECALEVYEWEGEDARAAAEACAARIRVLIAELVSK